MSKCILFDQSSYLSCCSHSNYSLWSMTISPMRPRSTVLSQGCSLSMMVTYPTICKLSVYCDRGARDHRTYRDIPSNTAHNVLLTVEIVLASSIQFRIIGKVVVTLKQEITMLVRDFEKELRDGCQRTLVKSMCEFGVELLNKAVSINAIQS